jgi:hypothetical protein
MNLWIPVKVEKLFCEYIKIRMKGHVYIKSGSVNDIRFTYLNSKIHEKATLFCNIYIPLNVWTLSTKLRFFALFIFILCLMFPMLSMSLDCPFFIAWSVFSLQFHNLITSICLLDILLAILKVWRYQRGNQKPLIVEGQTTQWPNEKGQYDKHYTSSAG